MRSGMWIVSCAAAGLVLGVPALGQKAGHDQEALKTLEAAKLTLTKAIGTAEEFSKGKAVAAHVKGGDVLVYCAANGKCLEVPVELKTGKATKMSEATIKEEENEHITKAAEIAKHMDESKLTLSKAIEAAEKHAQGKAVAARGKLAAGKLELVVNVVAGDKTLHVTVDGKTGQVLRSEEAKAGEKKADDKKHEDKKPAEKKPEDKKPEPKKP